MLIQKPTSETTVFVTGASNGIGVATAERFAKEGYQVVATARSPEKAHRLLAIAKQYQNLAIRQLDVTDSEENINTLINSIKAVQELQNKYESENLFSVVDIKNDASVAKWAKEVASKMGNPSILINNAALINYPKVLWEIPLAALS
jgi:NAD(P)-dependent dehydrogenase (short-subunit alcohol dehydrogenase family)